MAPGVGVAPRGEDVRHNAATGANGVLGRAPRPPARCCTIGGGPSPAGPPCPRPPPAPSPPPSPRSSLPFVCVSLRRPCRSSTRRGLFSAWREVNRSGRRKEHGEGTRHVGLSGSRGSLVELRLPTLSGSRGSLVGLRLTKQLEWDKVKNVGGKGEGGTKVFE